MSNKVPMYYHALVASAVAGWHAAKKVSFAKIRGRSIVAALHGVVVGLLDGDKAEAEEMLETAKTNGVEACVFKALRRGRKPALMKGAVERYGEYRTQPLEFTDDVDMVEIKVEETEEGESTKIRVEETEEGKHIKVEEL